MPPTPLLDDAAIEAIVRGDAPAGAGEALARFAAGVRAQGDGAPPPASPALAHLLAHGEPDGDGCAPGAAAGAAVVPLTPRAARRRMLARVAGLGLAAKLALGAGVAAAGVLGAGALPGTPGRLVRDAIRAVTPIELPGEHGPADPGRRGGVPTGDESVDLPGDHGDRVSSDATGESDGQTGVDGGQVAETAPGTGQRPGETPAATADPGAPQSTVPPGAPGRPSNPNAPADPGPPSSVPSTVPSTSTTTGDDGQPGDEGDDPAP
ncbi:MAG TPA: hypothetical protein VFZ77_16350 [Acidimicrobiales bacterium]